MKKQVMPLKKKGKIKSMIDKRVYSEVYCIIILLEESYRKRIPEKLLDFFDKERDVNYTISINSNKPLEEQNLLQDTINILAMLKLKYWCEDSKEKRKLMKLLTENGKKTSQQLT